MTIQDQINQFLSSPTFGVVGASTNRDKYGNKVLRCYQQNGKNVIPVNPTEPEIEGLPCVDTISDLPQDVESISIITPPAVTAKLVPLAIAKGIRNIWIQPGAGHPEAIVLCLQHGVNVIADGSCVLVVMGYHEQ
ncbi:MAG: CoA-binding protein [Desulfuromonadaceae bacterium]|nr:CoA-binding protein [Desulfuromonadaceae bacterium]MDD5105961.1 CoA-binding protein [Desulfuromonadaceae bacterium]